jgi:hypothetical protein
MKGVGAIAFGEAEMMGGNGLEPSILALSAA